MAILLPPMYTHSTYWLWAGGLCFSRSTAFAGTKQYLVTEGFNYLVAGFYVLAKIEEAADKPIYKWTHHIVSGHTLKHLCAAMVPVFLTLMLAKRTIDTERCLPCSFCPY